MPLTLSSFLSTFLLKGITYNENMPLDPPTHSLCLLTKSFIHPAKLPSFFPLYIYVYSFIHSPIPSPSTLKCLLNAKPCVTPRHMEMSEKTVSATEVLMA